ncbi:hypothetical protein C8J55DRAFT_432438 [Lentinula edodes]|uniref:CCHC-type domain-containing protein n=1 Tax=Lentinula lateritia TaxID=40482 RepID=A0A9W9A693_9AGAR|nr:hypothetical protein C8J55DRAFT_432438 [Lentinula edodes]
MAYAPPVTKFAGGKAETQNPVDFLRDFGNLMRAQQIQQSEWASFIQDYMKASSPADDWLNKAPKNALRKWPDFKVVFLNRFPAPEATSATPQEFDHQLIAMRITDDELLLRVGEAGYKYIEFAAELLRIAKLAGIDQTFASISSVRANLPRALHSRVGEDHANWTSFVSAIKKVSKAKIEENLGQDKRIRELERVAAAAEQVAYRPRAQLPPMPETLSKSLGRSLARVNLGPVLSRPMSNRPVASLTEEQRAVLLANSTRLPHHPNTEQGRADYGKQCAEWARTHGNVSVTYNTPVPLKPGTVAVRSRECYRCGKLGHRSRECTGVDQILKREGD